MKEQLWDREVLRRLREAVPGSSVSVALPSPGLVWSIMSAVLLGFLILTGPHLMKGQVPLAAAAGWSGLTWVLAGFGIVSAAWNVSGNLPWIPEILRRAPVDEVFLGRRAQRHARAQFRKCLIVSVVMAVFLVLGCGLAESSRNRPWSWSLAIPAGGLLWLHLVGTGALLARVVRVAARLKWRLPDKLVAALFLVWLPIVLLPVLSPLLLDGKMTGQWMVAAGERLAAGLPASAFLTWPAGGGLPWMALALTGAALAAGWPVLRGIAERLRTMPQVAGWSEACWEDDAFCEDEEWSDDEEDEEAIARKSAEAPLPAEAPPASDGDLETRCREALRAWQAPDARWFQPWETRQPSMRLERRAMVWSFLPAVVLLTVAHPMADLLAWVWLGASAWGLVPNRPWVWSCRRPVDLPWLPVSPESAWQLFTARHAALLREALSSGAMLAAGGLAAAAPGQLLESLWPWAGERDAWVNWIVPWRCALVVAMLPLLRAWWLWLSAPAAFWCEEVPRPSLIGFPPWRWTGFRLTAAAGTLCGTAGMVGLMASVLSEAGAPRSVWLSLAGWLAIGVACRVMAATQALPMWAKSRRR